MNASEHIRSEIEALGYPLGYPDPWPEVIYLIQTTDASGAVKVGWTRDLVGRLTNLQQAHPVPLRVLLVFSGSRKVEQEFHEKLARLRLRGEWYNLKESNLYLHLSIVRDRLRVNLGEAVRLNPAPGVYVAFDGTPNEVRFNVGAF